MFLRKHKCSMKVVYCHDNIYQQCPDGHVYSPGQFPYAYFKTFLDHFDHVQVVGRGVGIKTDINKLNISDGPNVSFTLFPNINTPINRLKYGRTASKRLKRIIRDSDAVIIRAVSDIGWMAFKHARTMKKPIAMEMAACGWDSTWNHGNHLGKLYAPIRYLRDRKVTKHSDYVIYVSQEFLQKRYPTNAQTAISSNVRIDAPDEDTISKRLEAIRAKTEFDTKPQLIGLIGHLDNKIKGVSDALKALKIVETQKPGSFIFKHLGPGDPAPYKKLAKELGIDHCVKFDGMLQSGPAVLEWLKDLDLYIQPSYQEGVPRATIEAMSMACPVIGSTAGGIPELLSPRWLIKPGNINHLSERIIAMLDSTPCQYEAGSENYMKSLEYTNDKLAPRKQAFWGAFREFSKSKQRSGALTTMLHGTAIAITMVLGFQLYSFYFNKNVSYAENNAPQIHDMDNANSTNMPSSLLDGTTTTTHLTDNNAP